MAVSISTQAEESSRSPLLRLRAITKQYGTVIAVRPTDLEIQAGDFFALLGPSGCGKTTLLRMIAGFVQPSAGSVEIEGADVLGLGPERRPTNTVFQGYGLFPHMSVRQNIAYGLRVAGVAAREIKSRCEEMIALVRLGELAERGIAELSGGQQQRIALARALVMRPKILLLDEPLAALDLKLRQTMQQELRRIHREIGGTFIFVTHDQTEAMAMANRIAVMQSGTITQEGAPEEIYARPRNRFVAEFIGDANLLPGRRSANVVTLEAGPTFADPGEDGRVVAIVRPEAMRLVAGNAGGTPVLEGLVSDVMYLGTHLRILLKLDNTSAVALHLTDVAARPAVRLGERLRVGWSTGHHVIVADRPAD